MEQVSFLELNDDCLLLVLKLLDLKDQISAALACEHFHALLAPLWKRKYLHFNMYDIEPIEDRDMHVVMKCIRETVKTMSLKMPYDITPFKYPSVHTLYLANSTDDNLLEMTKIFPNLRSLHITTSVSGKHIENWQHLQELAMVMSAIEFDNLEKILENLQLKWIRLEWLIGYDEWKSEHAFQKFCNLERIQLGSYNLKLLTNISLFTNLRVLTIFETEQPDTCYDNMVMDVAENRRNDLVELHASEFFPLKLLFVATYENLRKIIISVRHSDEFKDIDRCAPNLCEITIEFCKILREADILLWLDSARTNKLTYVEVCNCSFEFPTLTLNVKNIIKDRDRSLHFDFHVNFFDNERVTLTVEGESPLLKITSSDRHFYTIASELKLR